MPDITLFFPPDFLWGTTTAAVQVEGAAPASDWGAAVVRGEAPEGFASGTGWLDLGRALADFDLAAEMGVNSHRLSLDWSRLEPRPGQFDPEARDYYRAILAGLKARGIEPLVTLHHYANPRWFAEQGDFNGEEAVEALQRFTGYVVSQYGDIVSRWITFNEPMTYAYYRHLNPLFPAPAEPRGWRAGWRDVRGMLRGHAAMYHKIKEAYPEHQVGVAKNWLIFDGVRPGSPLDRAWAAWLSRAFNHAWMDAMARGRPGLLLGAGRIPYLAGTFDFVGLNYNTRRLVRRLSMTRQPVWAGSQESETGFGEIYPAGLMRAIRATAPYGKPIFITANGLPDRRDRQRPAFLATHLHQVWRAINHNFPIMGYFHRALIDTPEWEQGWERRFGLITVDPETHERRLRPSGRLYGEIARSYTLTSDMVERYAPQVVDVMFPV